MTHERPSILLEIVGGRMSPPRTAHRTTDVTRESGTLISPVEHFPSKTYLTGITEAQALELSTLGGQQRFSNLFGMNHFRAEITDFGAWAS